MCLDTNMTNYPASLAVAKQSSRADFSSPWVGVILRYQAFRAILAALVYPPSQLAGPVILAGGRTTLHIALQTVAL